MKPPRVVYLLLLGMVVLGMAIVAYQRTVNPTHSVTLDANGIAQELQGMSDRMTVKYVVQKMLSPHGDADPTQPMYMVQATVSAAVDLKELTGKDVRVSGASVSVRLPPPVITSTVIDESQTKVWDREVKMWTSRPSFDVLAGPGIRSDAVGWVDRQAQQSGLFADATRTAQAAIRNMLRGSGIERVMFTEAAATPAK